MLSLGVFSTIAQSVVYLIYSVLYFCLVKVILFSFLCVSWHRNIGNLKQRISVLHILFSALMSTRCLLILRNNATIQLCNWLFYGVCVFEIHALTPEFVAGGHCQKYPKVHDYSGVWKFYWRVVTGRVSTWYWHPFIIFIFHSPPLSHHHQPYYNHVFYI